MRNYGLGSMNAAEAFDAGASGQGITVAVIDSGADFSSQDLIGAFSSRSTDIVLGRNRPTGDDDHGTLVSGVIAARFNDYGTIGVAYESEILSIRADISDCDDPDDTVCFSSLDLARALDYAVANGARVVNLSLGGEGRLGAAFEAALLRAVQAGLVVAASSGNEGEDTPGWPGRYASDPRFLNRVVVVGAINSADVMASFSNRAGVTASRYIAAPGQAIVTGCDGATCATVNGTSFSSPHVAGALALLLDAFPNLTGNQAIQILLDTARDAGAAGVDPVYGRGILDLAEAFQPAGATTTRMATGGSVSVITEPGSSLGPAFGDALVGQPGLKTVIHDGFDRLFLYDLGAVYPVAPRRGFQPESRPASRTARLNIDGPAGMRFGLTASADAAEPEPIAQRFTPFDAPWMGRDQRQEAMVTLDAGPLGLAVWNGRGGARSPFAWGAGDSFAALAQPDRAARSTLTLGPVTVSTEVGVGDRLSAFRAVEEDAGAYGRVGLRYAAPRFTLTLAGGVLDERLGPLGGYMPSASPFAMASTTHFAAVGAAARVNARLSVDAEVMAGSTDARGEVFSLSEPAPMSGWRFGVDQACDGWGLGCRSLRFELSQPLRAEGGVFSAMLADVPADYFDPLTFSLRSVSATPTGRQIDLGVRSLHDLPDGSLLALEAFAIRQENHRREAEPGFAVFGQWRRPF